MKRPPKYMDQKYIFAKKRKRKKRKLNPWYGFKFA